MMFFSNYQANAISGSAPGELLITFKATTSPSQIMNLQAELDATVIDSIPELGVYHWRIPDTVISASGTILLGVDEVAAYYEYHPDIRYIEPDIYFELTTHLPSGYAAVQPWNLEKIEAPAAWHIQTETDTLVVSVLDTGIDWTHPDLVNHIWQNLAEDKDNDGQTIQYISGQWVLDPDDLDGDDNDNLSLIHI